MAGFLCFLVLTGASPWAADASESVGHLLEVARGSETSGLVSEWSVPEWFDAVEIASRMLNVPDVWTDRCLVLDQVTGVPSSGSGFLAHQSERCWRARRWRHVDSVRHDVGDGLVCKGFCSVPGLFTVCSEGCDVGCHFGSAIL